MKPFWLLTPLITMISVPALAQTVLSLNASAPASAPPDEAVAQFNVQATKPDAAAAQAAVNQAVAKALAAARAVAGVTATTGFYNTYETIPEHQAKPAFTAQQSLTLVQPASAGVPDKAFSDLLAQLQSEGLLLTGLSGDLSTKGTDKLQREAIHAALLQLHDEAEGIAADLNTTIGTLQSLTVETDNFSTPPMRLHVLAMAPAAAPPQSAPGNITITARVSAKIMLNSAK